MTFHKYSKILLATAIATTSLVLAGCGGSSGSGATADNGTDNQVHTTDMSFKATIKYTDAGVPHITASNLKNAGFASGYVQAKANACILADQFIRVKGERSLYYGPGPSVQQPLSPYFAGANIISDFSMKAMGIHAYAQTHFSELSKHSQDLLTGFAAGYDYYLEETDNLTTGDAKGRFGKCAGQPWVKAVSPTDILAYYAMVARYASGMQFATGASFFASPDGNPQSALPHFVAQTAANLPDIAPKNRQVANLDSANFPPLDMRHMKIGSNGWGLGGNMTESGKGALLANPHFPYTGSRRLFQLQLDIPSIGYNVNGGALLGVAIPLIGYNQHVAWTHTVSTAHHFTVYELQLANNNPLQFIKDGKPHKITPKTFQIKVKAGGNAPVTMAKTFYYAYPDNPQFGPMLNLNVASSLLPKWGQASATKSSVAFTYRDANVDTAIQMMDQWLSMGQATDLTTFQKAFQGHQYDNGTKTACSSVLWVNTMYADDQGNAFYIDGTAAPNLKTNAQLLYLQGLQGANPAQPTIAQALFTNGVTVLDGSTSLNDWQTNQCSSGNIGYSGMPQLANQTFVQNSNDSFWMTNPTATAFTMSVAGLQQSPPSIGYSLMYGYLSDIQHGLSPRTRMGLSMLMAPTNPGASTVPPMGSTSGFSAKDIINNLYGNRAFYPESMLTDLMGRCVAIGTQGVVYDSAGDTRKVAQGCAALGAWAQSQAQGGPHDGAVYDASSGVGTVVFRTFIGNYLAGTNKRTRDAKFKAPFSIQTLLTASTPQAQQAALLAPHQLPTPTADITKDPALAALAKGLNDLDQAGINYAIGNTTTLGDVQCQQQSSSVPPGGTPSPVGTCLPWPGNQNIEGGFNIVEPYISNVDQDTMYPRLSPQPSEILPNTGQLSDGSVTGLKGWQIGRGTSWHFGLEFTSNGPVAYGLVSYSQSADAVSPHSNDQDKRYSNQDPRELKYLTRGDIQNGGSLLQATVAVPN